MKQVFQDLKSGDTMLVEAPAPTASRGTIVVETATSLVSSGTERMLVEFGRATYLDKARQQPEKVRQVLDKARTDGVLATIAAVQSKLEQPLPLGYSNVGVVTGIGPGVTDFRVGDRVVSNGPHADVVRVPTNLCAHVPDTVDDESAAFTVVASIGLQGVRLLQPALGEAIVVTGAGLIGLLTVQILIAHGCRVLAIDMDASRLELARRFGAATCNPALGDDPVAAAMSFSRNVGIDGVIITASTTTSEPVSQAARMCRKRGRIVLVGVTGLELNRSDFYAKELTFQVSCSYGAGRYDPEYEERGHDYPVGYVRWTVRRNFEAVLDLLASGRLDVSPLVTRRFTLADAPDAYRALLADKGSLGILLQYPRDERRGTRRMTLAARAPAAAGKPVVGFIGAGNHASRVLIPAFKAAGAELHTISTSGGASASIQGRKAGFAHAASEVDAVLGNAEINTVVVATRHDSHAALAIAALDAGKHVFVEKPLALNDDDLNSLEAALQRAAGRVLTVGFNRRFAPHVRRMKSLLANVHEPATIVVTVNAGALPADHWLLDPQTGGGRILGEGCHFIDLVRHLAGSAIESIDAQRLASRGAPSAGPAESALISMRFSGGSVGTVHYLSNGASSYPKERVEVFCAGRVMQLENFRALRGYGWPGLRSMNLWRQDKGQHACVAAFVDAIERGLAPPIPIDEMLEVSRASIEAAARLA